MGQMVYTSHPASLSIHESSRAIISFYGPQEKDYLDSMLSVACLLDFLKQHQR
jgi:hypothetical protein